MGSRRRDRYRDPADQGRRCVHFFPGEGKYWRWPGAGVLCKTTGSPVATTPDPQLVTCGRCLPILRVMRGGLWNVLLKKSPAPWPARALRAIGMLSDDAPDHPPPVTPIDYRPRVPTPAQPHPLLAMAARWRGQASQLFAGRTQVPGAALAAGVLTSAAAELEDLVEQIRKGAA